MSLPEEKQEYLERDVSSSMLTYHRGGGSFPFFSCINPRFCKKPKQEKNQCIQCILLTYYLLGNKQRWEDIYEVSYSPVDRQAVEGYVPFTRGAAVLAGTAVEALVF